MEFLILYYLCFLVFCWIYSHFSSCILIRFVKMVPAWCQGRTTVISMVVFCHFDAKMLFIRQPKNEKCIHLCTIRMQKYDNEKFRWAHNVGRRENLIGLYSFSFNLKLFAHSSVFKQIHSKIVGTFFFSHNIIFMGIYLIFVFDKLVFALISSFFPIVFIVAENTRSSGKINRKYCLERQIQWQKPTFISFIMA